MTAAATPTPTAASTPAPSRPSRPAPGERSLLRQVGVPAEHGGWGLSLEPALLGLLVAPSGSGVALAVAAVGCFVARTPLRVLAVDHHRGRHLERDDVAARLLVAEVAVLGALAVVATIWGDPIWWVPALAAAPVAAVELWFDVRSRSRRLVPEVAGALAVAAAGPAVVLAGGGDPRRAVVVWLVLAARVATSLPFVRDRIARLHGRPGSPLTVLAGDLGALALAAGAVALDRAALAGAIAVVVLVASQRLLTRRRDLRPALLGAAESVLGLAVVLTAGLGLLAP